VFQKQQKISGKLFLLFICMIFFISCELFTTRTPEPPDDNSVNYPPATSPGILLSNFNNSIKGLNTEYYYDCFLKPSGIDASEYNYVPDPDALARYGVIFNQWNALSERNFLIGLKSSIESMINPQIIWENGNYEVMTSDSAIYLGQYQLSVSLQKKLENYFGIARLSFVRTNSGLWYIKSWQDFQLNFSDTTKTWSILKAQISS
jgi:hypothetical protein